MNVTYILDTLTLRFHIRRKVLLQTFLTRYLKEDNLYVGFRNNIINHSFRKVEILSDIFNAQEYPGEIIDRAFVWRETLEEEKIWQHIYETINPWWERLLESICDTYGIKYKESQEYDRRWFIS